MSAVRRTVAPVVRIAAILAAITLVACADAATSPKAAITGKKAPRDSIFGDTTLCRSGYVILEGRYVCNGEG